ncbi:MAG: hypothetical protein ACREH5_09470 [Candidatus Omnitrophota bacterium]
MNKEEIFRFFGTLAELYKEPCRIILTGAGAGVLYGRVRATMDLDFALKVPTKDPQKYEKEWKHLEDAIKETSLRTSIDAQYAEDIDRWSSITLLDYEKHAYLFKCFGNLELMLLEPPYWSIGKFGRYLDPDIRDLILVFQKTNTPWKVLAAILGQALKASPKSNACYLFRRQVEDFFKNYGKEAWGNNFSAESAILEFQKSAGITPS